MVRFFPFRPRLLRPLLSLPTVLVAGLLALAATPESSGRTVRVAGSDLLPPALYESLVELAAARGDELLWSNRGSLPAFDQLDTGRADLILVALPERTPGDFPYPVLPLAYGIGVLAVHRDNPVISLRPSEITALFAGDTGNPITRWSELGITGDPWAGRSLTAVYADPPDRPVTSLLRARFFEGQPIRAGIPAFPSSAAAEAFLLENEGALGLLGRTPRSRELRAVPLAGENHPAFGPTAESVNFGDYPLSLLYAVAVPRSQFRELEPYLAHLLSAETAALLRSEGFVPLLPALRQEWIRSLP